MSKPNFFEVSDGLMKMKTIFERHETCVMKEKAMRIMITELGRLYREARALENEISAKRWNEEGVADRRAALRGAAANVVVLEGFRRRSAPQPGTGFSAPSLTGKPVTGTPEGAA